MHAKCHASPTSSVHMPGYQIVHRHGVAACMMLMMEWSSRLSCVIVGVRQDEPRLLPNSIHIHEKEEKEAEREGGV
jgi:hypothetical protein